MTSQNFIIESKSNDELLRLINDDLLRLVMDPNEPYLKLSTNIYEASMGNEYFELRENLEDWGYKLHEHGLNLSVSDMELIFKFGIMDWYILEITKIHRILLKFKTYITNVKNGNIRIVFYDFKELMILYSNIDQDVRPQIPKELSTLILAKNYQIFLKDNGWNHPSFHQHLFKERIMNSYLNFVQLVIDSIYKNVKYIDNTKIVSNVLNIEYLRNAVLNDDLRKLGIVFQRWKIIVEKMGGICQKFETDKTMTTERKERIYSNFLIIDRLTTRIQELIYLMINQSIASILNTPDLISENINLPIYHTILNWIRNPNSNNCLNPVSDYDLVSRDIRWFLHR